MISSWVTSPWIVSVTVSMVAFKIWMKVTTGRYYGKEKLVEKTAVVTGANSGVGLETVRDLAGRGARIVMVCRDMQKAERVKNEIIKETGNANIVVKNIDFESLESVRKCAEEILLEEKYIHILLNNAGAISGCFTKTKDGLDALMQTNYFGPFLFTNILLGCIKTSAPSRIINVSSELHKAANLDLKHLDLSNISSTNTAYGNSKLCLILMANELADKLKNTGVVVNSLTPGVVYTDILRNTTAWFRVPWNFITKIFLKNSKEGAQTLIYASISPIAGDVTGKYFMDCKLSSVSVKANDKKLSKELWQISETVVNLKPNEKHF